MKQNLLFVALLAFSLPVFSQQEALQQFTDKYKHEAAFTYAFLSKDLFDIATKNEGDASTWRSLHQVVRNIGALSVLAADSIESGQALYKEAVAAVPINDFDELFAVQDGSDRVKIWVKETDNVVSDLVLLAGTRHEFVLICFAGNLELGNISELASMFNAGSVEQLAKSSDALAAVFQISPNPGDGLFSLVFETPADAATQLTVFDQNGRQISVLNLSGAPTQQLNLSNLPSGNYWLQVKTNSGKIGVRQIQIVK